MIAAPEMWAFATQEPTLTTPPASNRPEKRSYGVSPSSSRCMAAAMAEQPEVQTTNRRLANSVTISATSFPPSG